MNQGSTSFRLDNNEDVGVIIVSAGEGQRMGGIDKIRTLVSGRPLLAYGVDAFEMCRYVKEIVIVLASVHLEWGRELVQREGWKKVSSICSGGKTRIDSAKYGFDALSSCHWVMVHDGARPCVTVDLINRGVDCVPITGAAIPAVPVKDTIKQVDVDRLVVNTPPRESLWSIQTPQIFEYDILRRVYMEESTNVTDDSTLVERLGYSVKVFEGSYDNVKITTPEDLKLVETLLLSRHR